MTDTERKIFERANALLGDKDEWVDDVTRIVRATNTKEEGTQLWRKLPNPYNPEITERWQIAGNFLADGSLGFIVDGKEFLKWLPVEVEA